MKADGHWARAVGPSRFAHDYHALLTEILDVGFESVNRRTGVRVRTLHGARMLRFVQPAGHPPIVPTPGNRIVRPYVSAAEAVWMLRGERTVEWLRRHTSIWNEWSDDAGEMTHGTVAYGHKLRGYFGRDQVMQALLTLMRDPTSRQVYLSLWDPCDDGLLSSADNPKANVPCPVGWAMSIVGERLHLSVHMRSSDAFVGLPYDVMTFTIIGHLVANSLRVQLGSVAMTLANCHVYEPQWDVMAASIDLFKDTPFPEGLPLEGPWYDAVSADLSNLHQDEVADAFVGGVKAALNSRTYARVCGSTLDMKPKVVV